MARDLGYDNFVALGYKRMLRTDYNASDVARYREEIERDIVPLCKRIVATQTKRLGVEELRIWDEGVFHAGGNPKPPAYSGMIGAVRDTFAAMNEELAHFSSLMIDRSLLDLQLRDGKAGGGFCTSFPIYGLPYIFANFNGTTHDVNVLVHEMGHAFQCYSSRDKALSDYLWPTYDACEIHSMAMEFLTWPHLDRFFGDDAQRYRAQHLASSLLFLPYGAAVDHFQHLVYEHPNATNDERNGFWKEMEARYLPWRHNGGIPYLERGGLWQQQRHIFVAPFYYIDYTLALNCALQFWMRSLDDYPAALADYTTLCKRGGEAPFQTLVRSAGLRSPFESGVLAAIARRAESVFGEDAANPST
jgi:M3 family oligoendopeptidase